MQSLQKALSSKILSMIRSRRGADSAIRSGNNTARFLPPAKLREAKFSDFDSVARLKQRCGLAPDSIENWQRLWLHNPALAHSTASRPIGWVLEADREIVGYLGNISLECRFVDRTISAVSSHGFVVDPAYRGVALSLSAAFYRQKSVELFIASSAIESTAKMSLAFKCTLLPQPDYDTVLFWILRPYSFARVLMTKLHIQPLLSPMASAFVAFAIMTDKLIKRRWPKQTPRSLVVKEGGLHNIDGDLEALWKDKEKEDKRLYADRTADVLRWHFEIPGDRGSVRVLRCEQDGKLSGYAIVRSDTDAESGNKRSIIADLIARDDDPEVVRALWFAAYQCAKSTGSDVLEVQGFPANIREVFYARRPYQRAYPICPYNYKAADPVLHSELNNPAVWYACPYDGDATLIRASYPSSAALPAAEPMESQHSAGTVGLADVRRTEVF